MTSQQQIIKTPEIVELPSIFTDEETQDDGCYVCSGKIVAMCIQCKKPICWEHGHRWCKNFDRACQPHCHYSEKRVCSLCVALRNNFGMSS